MSGLRAGTGVAAAAALSLALSASAVRAADPQLCAACHGPDGNSTQPAMPSLAGQPAQFIATQLFRYTRGEHDLRQPLSDKDIEVLADYLAGLGLP